MTTDELYYKIIDHAVKRIIYLLQDMGFSPVHIADVLKVLNDKLSDDGKNEN